LAQPIKKTERLEHGSIDANPDGWVSLFDTLKSRPASKGAFRHDPSREPPTSSRIVQVVPKLA
jgi:hypothetical protein